MKTRENAQTVPSHDWLNQSQSVIMQKATSIENRSAKGFPILFVLNSLQEEYTTAICFGYFSINLSHVHHFYISSFSFSALVKKENGDMLGDGT